MVAWLSLALGNQGQPEHATTEHATTSSQVLPRQGHTIVLDFSCRRERLLKGRQTWNTNESARAVVRCLRPARSASGGAAPAEPNGTPQMAPKKKGKDKKEGSGGGEAERPASAPVKKAEPAADAEEVEDAEEAAQGNKRDGADVSKVTDFAEEKEMDQKKASQAIAAITDSLSNIDLEAEARREKELAAVKIKQARRQPKRRCATPARHRRPCLHLGAAASAAPSLRPPASPPTPPPSRLWQEDVDLIANEMELDKGLAERKLREHGGDPLQTLITLVTDPAALPGGTSS